MKRNNLIVAAALCLLLCACGKSEAAVEADTLIQNIGPVTLEREQAIQHARECVDGLTPEEMSSLEYLEELEQAETTYEALLHQQEADELIEVISRIPSQVSLEDDSGVFYARNLYNRASKDARALVTNFEILTDAEEQLRVLKIAYVSETIDSLKSVSLDDEEKITTAEKYYYALSDEDQNSIPNGEDLFTASQKLEELKAAEKERLKKNALSALRSQTDKVTGMTWYFPSAYPQYANSRSFVLPYLGVSEYSTWLRLQYHYTGNDWVFFDSITVAVDDQRYYYTYDYFDVDRDNGSGMVWEWIDVSPSAEEIEMLQAIVDSEETIVRFQGDPYQYDLTVSQSDKKAIAAVLETYEILTQS